MRLGARKTQQLGKMNEETTSAVWQCGSVVGTIDPVSNDLFPVDNSIHHDGNDVKLWVGIFHIMLF